MALPRKYQIPEGEPGFYHCISRCVRHSFLCGFDRHSGQSFEHRRQWFVNRLNYITQYFAIDVYSYAIVHNHVHLVLYTDPERANEWDYSEVTDRWRKLYRGVTTSPSPTQIENWRRQLSSISWFMKCLKEPIARRANLEDGCTGHFWERRFKSVALLDETAVIACMTYVDLNPIRAGIANSPRESDYTSIQQRIKESNRNQQNQRHHNNPILIINEPIKPIMGFDTERISIKGSQYIKLVEETASPEKNYSVTTSSLFNQLGIHPNSWYLSIHQFKNTFGYIAGNLIAIEEFMQRTGRKRRPRKTEVLLYRKATDPPER